MFCRYCGKALPDNSKFCSNCGRSTSVVNNSSQNSAMFYGSQNSPGNSDKSSYSQPNNYPNSLNQGVSGYGQSRWQQNAQMRQQGYNQPNYTQQGYNGYGNQQPGGYYQPYTLPKRKKKKGWLIAVILIIIGIACGILLSDDSDDLYSEYIPHSNYNSGTSSGSGVYSSDLDATALRDFYTNVSQNEDCSVTVMVYMVGSDLESLYGCATDDIQEMIDSDVGENVKIVLQTGGTQEWANNVMTDEEVERWLIEDGEIYSLASLGESRMLTSDALCSFISFAAENYPAERYILIFWDHGGGSVYGFGYDEIYTDDSLYLPDIAQALKDAKVKFDVVGFDACLMANIETAFMLEPYADYLIASEETEPSGGWYYTDWLSALEENPSMDSVDLGIKVVDSYVQSSDNYQTLSVTSLREIPRVYEALNKYMESANEMLFQKNYTVISTARANAKSYAEGEYDLIDIVDFTKNLDVVKANDLVDCIRSAVKYRNNCQIQGSCGLSMYFPYSDLYSYEYAKSFFSGIGYSGSCYEFFDNFVNIMAGGKVNYEQRTIQDLLITSEGEDYEEYEWYNSNSVESYDYADGTFTMPTPEYIDGKNVLPLSDLDWENIVNIEVQAWLDDGEGYADLGSDQYYELDDNDNLLLNFDNTWVSLDDVVVAYYSEGIQTRYDGTNVFTGYVPAILNDTTYIEIMLKYDDDSPYGYVEGYRVIDDSTNMASRDLLQFKENDEIYFVYDFYDYDGNYQSSYTYEDMYIIYSGEIEVGYTSLEDSEGVYWYMVNDVYQNSHWTEAMFF